jgi:metal-dependent amidase/aminoacylase/carboxypeptidase family protein
MATCSTTREEQTTMSNVEEALTGLEETTSWQEELYKHLHAHPELSFEEVQTRAEIRRRLKFSVSTCRRSAEVSSASSPTARAAPCSSGPTSTRFP